MVEAFVRTKSPIVAENTRSASLSFVRNAQFAIHLALSSSVLTELDFP